MTLIVEALHHAPPSPAFLINRNTLMAQHQLATPIVYEQQVVCVREDYAVCLTLCEPIAICQYADMPLLRAESLF
jgi:hypothetical protein